MMLSVQTAKKIFSHSAAMLFLFTGTAKVWSASGSAELLQRLDPIFGIKIGDGPLN